MTRTATLTITRTYDLDELAANGCDTDDESLERQATSDFNSMRCDWIIERRTEAHHAICGCGYPLLWIEDHWEHDAAPSLWGNDHDPDVDAP